MNTDLKITPKKNIVILSGIKIDFQVDLLKKINTIKAASSI